MNVRIRVYAKFAALAALADAAADAARAAAATHAATHAAAAAYAAARGAYSKIDFVAMAKLAIEEALKDAH